MVLLRTILRRVAPCPLVLRYALSPLIPVLGAHALDRVRIDALLVRYDLLLLRLCISAARGLLLALLRRLASAHLPVNAVLLRVGVFLVALALLLGIVVHESSLSADLLHLPLAQELGVLDQLVAKVRALVAEDEGIAVHALLAHHRPQTSRIVSRANQGGMDPTASRVSNALTGLNIRFLLQPD